MKAVVQKHSMSCGLACVASLSGVDYDNVLRVVKKEFASTRGYYCRELIDALKKLGLSYEYKKVTDRTKSLLQKSGMIVFIARSKKYPAGHYLLHTTKGWMNPWINYPEIAPTKAGFSKRLPGKAQWILIPKEK